MGTVEETV